MKITKYLPIMAAAFLLLGAACAKTTEIKNVAVNQPANIVTANANQPIANSNSNQAETNKTVAEKTADNSLATPSDAYKAAYSAREKKDIENLKKVLSKDALDFFTEMSKADDKTLDEGLKGLVERPQAKTAETRNEKINGDRATLEYLDEKGGWETMDFAKDGKDWKLTIAKPDPKDLEINGKKPQ